jgi:hypothetical protein
VLFKKLIKIPGFFKKTTIFLYEDLYRLNADGGNSLKLKPGY